MPTVALDCRYITDKPSGIGNYVRGLVDWLPELAPDIDWLFIRSSRARAPLSRAPNVREQVVRAVASGPETMWAMPLIADLRAVQLFHGPFNIQPAFLDVDVITTIHDTMWLRNPEICRQRGPWGAIETFYWQHGMRRALRESKRLLTVSEASRRAIDAEQPGAGARTRVTHLGIDPDLRAATEDDASAIAGLREKHLPRVDKYVLSVGQFNVYKNHPGVLRAFTRAFASREDLHLVFVHRLGRSSRLLPLARELGVEHRVHFLHGLSPAELRALFWGAACLAQPSFIEGFGLPIAEAMACGLPVITSNVSAMPEVAGNAALLVDPHDLDAIATALRRVVDDPSVAAELRAKGLARAQYFRFRRMAEETLAVYRELL
jgi:glycosyltransferase involved in cell wall biosynthesis